MQTRPLQIHGETHTTSFGFVMPPANRSCAIADAPTDWRSLNADLEFATGQANTRDHTPLASEGETFVPSWTDIREGCA